MSDVPQTFDALIEAIAGQSASKRPVHVFFLWFKLTRTDDRGIIFLQNTSHMSWRRDITFAEMKAFGDSDVGDWDILLMTAMESKHGNRPTEEQVTEVIDVFVTGLANGPQPIQNQAMFDRDGNRVDALDFAPDQVN